MTEKSESFRLSSEQHSVFLGMENTQENYFITGKAGTGKSVLLRYFVEHTRKTAAVVAPTGIAAVHVGGQTIHSFFGMDTSVQDTREILSIRNSMDSVRRNLLSALDTLIIDEVSMVRADVLDMIDLQMRLAREKDRPFGGCQMILFGDLYQLPPVVKEDEIAKFLLARYGTAFFFGAPGYERGRFRFVELTNVFRQNDPAFIEMLNHIRSGDMQWQEMERLNSRHRPLPLGRKIITLTPRNDTAQRINQMNLDELPGDTFRYEGSVDGAFGEDEMPTGRVLALKAGAQIMMLRNDTRHRWYNGTFGKIAELSEDGIRVEIGDQVYPVEKKVWIQYAYTYDPERQTVHRQKTGSFRQYPIRLAYAITIHKSQGQTFDAAQIDYSDGTAFAPGQTYVALSRCRSFDALYLTADLSLEDVRVNQEIIDFMKRYAGKGRIALSGKKMQVLQGQGFSDSVARLPKAIRVKVQPAVLRLMESHDLTEVQAEKMGEDGLYAVHVDEQYRMVFDLQEEKKVLSLLYVGPEAWADRFAQRYKVEINPVTGGLQQVEKAPKRISASAGKRLSRLSALSEEQLVRLEIPEAYWTQLREKVFTAGQLTAFRGLLPEETYETLGFVLDGTPADEAMELWESMTSAVTPVAVEEQKPLFEGCSAEELASVGIPSDNIDKVLRIKTDKELEIIARTLPVLAQQSLYALRAGDTIEEIRKTTFSGAKENRNGNMDAAVSSNITLAEFAPIDSEEALRAILEYPSEKWRVFLHPTQNEIVRQDYNGPARIVGGAGTGKTVVIVHRAKRLAGECAPGERILVTTFGNTLKHDIEERIREICSETELDHLSVMTVDKLTYDLTRSLLGKRIAYASGNGIRLTDLWEAALKASGMEHVFGVDFCMDEWRDVIQGQHLGGLEAYLAAQRSGRGKQFDRAGRERFWKLAEQYRLQCEQRHVIDADWAQNLLADRMQAHPEKQYRSVMVDECQDLRMPALRMLRALAGEQRRNDLYLSGDSRQRIYGGRTSLSQCGININNRSRVLKLNYRTTHEIYQFAMQLQKDYQYDDMDGKSMSKDQATCIFHGPAPVVRRFNGQEEEVREMIRDIRNLIAASVQPTEICIMLRSRTLLSQIQRQMESNGLRVLTVTNQQPDDKSIPGVRIMTMHRGKGMEFSYVYLPCLSRGVLPSSRDLTRAAEEETAAELMQSEANLLSVAITRAKRQVWLSYTGEPSELIARYVSQT